MNYNTQGLVASRTDGRGNTTKYEYDGRGNVVKTSEQIAGAATENTDGNLFTGSIRAVTQTGLEFFKPTGSDPLIFADTPRAVGDINKDGFNDIIIANRNQTYNILMGDADGLFANRSSLTANAFDQIDVVNQLDLKDVDGDGDLDLIANLPIDDGGSDTSGFLSARTQLQDPVLVYLNRGDGQFDAPEVLPLQAKSDGFVTGDFNGDGKLDIVVRSDIYSAQINGVYPLVLYTGDGKGNWSQSKINITGIDPNSSFVGGLQMLAIDIDKDGRTELVFNQPDGLSIYKYANPCVWLKADSYGTDFDTSRYQMTTGDVNQDGLTDIVTIGSERVNMFLGQKNGTFQVKQVNPFDNDLVFSSSNSRLQIVDVNGDRKTDLAVFGTDTGNRQSVKIYTLNGAEDVIQLGNVTKVNDLNPINGVQSRTKIDRLADINGDGTAELLLLVQNPANGGFDLGVMDNRSIVRETVNLTKSYAYDSKFNKLTSATDELGRKTLYDLDSNTGNVLKTTRVVGLLDTISGETNDVITSYTYTSSGQLDIITDALGRLTDYDYDVYGNNIKTTSAKGTLDEAVVQYQYDASGNRIVSIDALGHQTKYVHNSTNMLLQTINVLGGTTTYNYDKMGHQTKVTDALGHVTSMTYDSRGRLVSTLDANGMGSGMNAYDNNGNLLSSTDALGRVTSFQYDARNRQIATINPDGSITKNQYDANNQITGDTDALGRKTQKFYDARNRVIREIDVLGNETKYSYDATNQLIATTDAKGRTTTYQHDELGRQIATTDALGQVTRAEYDKLGNVVATIDANGNRTEYVYDALNRRVRVKDAQGAISKTSYDKVGNILSITDPVNNATTYSYDELNRLITDTNQLGKTRTFSYDAVGNKISTTDRDGRIISNAYDNLNRFTSEKWLASNGTVLNQIVANYDAIGQLSSTYDFNSKYTYTYDLNSRVTSIDNTGTSGVPSVLLNYAYDANSNTIAVNDKINGVSAGTLAYTYDDLDRVTQITQSGAGVQSKRVNMTYDALSGLSSLNRYGDLTGTQLAIGTNYSYDSLHRLTGISHKNAANVAVNSYNYQYDLASRISQISSVDGVVDYNYDATNQLTDADYTTQTDEAYSYDANGNRTNSGYATGVNNQLLSDGIYDYTYDDEGNRTRRTEIATGKVTEYSWDYHNRLTSVAFKDAGGVVTKTIEYLYDVNDLRIGKKIDGVVTERYVLDRDQISLVFDGTGNQTHRYLYGTEVDQVLADEVVGSTRWMLADHQGTIKDVVDGAGAILDHIGYDSFGNVVSQINPIDLRFGYTGRDFDSETGLNYYRARYYDPSVGRFISEDPIGFGAGDNNLTRYVKNNAINAIDPSGEITFILPGGRNEFGILPLSLLIGARYPVIPIGNPPGVSPSNDPVGAVRAANAFFIIQGFLSLGGGLKCDEPINIVAHSDGSGFTLNALVDSLKLLNLDANIYAVRLDPTLVPWGPNRLAAKTYTVASNKFPSRNGADIAAYFWFRNPLYRPDYRANKGVSHMDLLSDLGVRSFIKSRIKI
jgi:RHS repeat-associated protein